MESGYNFGALSWAECEEMCARLEKSLVTSGIDTALIVARGGLSVAGMLLQNFKPRCIRVVKASSYDRGGQKQEVLFDAYSIQALYELRQFYGGTRCHKVAIIDDIWDTGDTIKAIRHYIPMAQAFCMVRRGEPPMLESFEARNHFGSIVHDDTWVKFPWEAR